MGSGVDTGWSGSLMAGLGDGLQFAGDLESRGIGKASG